MASQILQAYDISIVISTYVCAGLLISSVYLLRKDLDSVEYAIIYGFAGFILLSSTITGLGLAYGVSEVLVSGIDLILMFSILTICSNVIAISFYYILTTQLKKSIFTSTLSVFTILLTISLLILLGVRVSKTMIETIPLIGLSGGSGFLIFSLACGFISFLLSSQIGRYLEEISKEL
jgi:hypothetical protein